jgi:ubiquinone/menaquinone biosynthesis C-methylase UbiE
MHNPAEQWERFGRADPYYGVYSQDAFRRENLDDAALETFFASGEEHVEQVLARVQRLVAPDFAPETVLDHGCGVGRLVVAFAESAASVVGVDVSPSMLAEARRNCDARGLTNVELVTADQLDALPPRFDLVHSFIVLQHIPPRQGEEIFETLASLVRPGGAGVIHVPIGVRDWRTRAHAWASRRVPYAPNVANRLRGRPWSYPHMQMNVYRLNALAAALLRQGCDVLHLELHPSGGGGVSFASATLVFSRGADQRQAISARS